MFQFHWNPSLIVAMLFFSWFTAFHLQPLMSLRIYILNDIILTNTIFSHYSVYQRCRIMWLKVVQGKLVTIHDACKIIS